MVQEASSNNICVWQFQIMYPCQQEENAASLLNLCFRVLAASLPLSLTPTLSLHPSLSFHLSNQAAKEFHIVSSMRQAEPVWVGLNDSCKVLREHKQANSRGILISRCMMPVLKHKTRHGNPPEVPRNSNATWRVISIVYTIPTYPKSFPICFIYDKDTTEYLWESLI